MASGALAKRDEVGAGAETGLESVGLEAFKVGLAVGGANEKADNGAEVAEGLSTDIAEDEELEVLGVETLEKEKGRAAMGGSFAFVSCWIGGTICKEMSFRH